MKIVRVSVSVCVNVSIRVGVLYLPPTCEMIQNTGARGGALGRHGAAAGAGRPGQARGEARPPRGEVALAGARVPPEAQLHRHSSAKLWRARSRLYRSQILQVNTRWN